MEWPRKYLTNLRVDASKPDPDGFENILKDVAIGWSKGGNLAGQAEVAVDVVCSESLYLSDSDVSRALNSLWGHCYQNSCDGQWVFVKRHTGKCNFCRDVYVRATGYYSGWDARNALLGSLAGLDGKYQLIYNEHCFDGQKTHFRTMVEPRCTPNDCGWMNVQTAITRC